MDVKQAKQLIRGPMVAVATPFKQNLELDKDALQHNIRFMVDRGIKRGRGVLWWAAPAASSRPSVARSARK